MGLLVQPERHLWWTDCPARGKLTPPSRGETALALRTAPTERQLRIGFELRTLRERSGLTVQAAGEVIDMGRVHLTHAENGRTPISAERIRTLCRTYGVTSSTFTDALVSLAESNGKGWWSSHKSQLPASALDLAELEAEASGLRLYESLFLPGLFQVEGYTRAIFEASDTVSSAAEIDTAVRFRQERQCVLTAERPPYVHAVIHEAALHMRFGGAEVMHQQLLKLVELSELPHVDIQIMPFTAVAVSALTTPFCHIASHDSALETVLLEHPAQSMFLHEEGTLAKYRRQFERLRAAALPAIDATVIPVKHAARDSLGLVQHVLYTLQGAQA
ncbi:helix-turn-helix domain-containing protein [Streptomyces sp. NPDC048441]|uniref:helix-turn-helix domain-containing protein n=1 Tax=Streptomyces sp. NPDC048441 TaxID=3365552 RepID=UPI00371B8DF0